ncbi:hypothetical protein [uncultured Sphingomonas sp.]|uniref:hypothetical protein n=1 Tax=uncultured Sphingomonas sp. TaxID=158754 RepID=UPI0035CB9968
MSGVEQRIADALADLEGLLADGVAVTAAVEEAARIYDFKPQNLHVRAVKELGDLEEIRAKFARLKKERERDTFLRKRVADYVERFLANHPKAQLPFVPINRWIKNEFIGDRLERDIAFAEARIAIVRQKKLIDAAEQERAQALHQIRERNAED